MTNTHITCLLRFLFWFLFAAVLREYQLEPKMHQVIAILALWEIVMLLLMVPAIKTTKTSRDQHHHDDLRSS